MVPGCSETRASHCSNPSRPVPTAAETSGTPSTASKGAQPGRPAQQHQLAPCTEVDLRRRAGS